MLARAQQDTLERSVEQVFVDACMLVLGLKQIANRIFFFEYRGNEEFSEYSPDKNDVTQCNDRMQMTHKTGMPTLVHCRSTV